MSRVWGRARTGGQGKPWTAAERKILRQGRERPVPLTFEQIAKQLPGRTRNQCSCQWQNRRTWDSQEERPGAGLIEMTRVPQHVQADRDARYHLRFNVPRTLTAQHFGDPLPGRSALDAKLRDELAPRPTRHDSWGNAMRRDTRPARAGHARDDAVSDLIE